LASLNDKTKSSGRLFWWIIGSVLVVILLLMRSDLVKLGENALAFVGIGESTSEKAAGKGSSANRFSKGKSAMPFSSGGVLDDAAIPVAFKGRVLNEAGRTPIAGARVRMQALSSQVESIEKTTGDDGVFKIDAPAAYRYEMRVEAEGFNSYKNDALMITRPSFSMDIVLSRALAVKGRVVDPQSQGIPNAIVGLFPEGGDQPLSTRPTDAQGVFSLPLSMFRGGRFQLDAIHAGYDSAGAVTAKMPAEEEIILRMKPASRTGALVGLVRDTAQRPIVGAKISISDAAAQRTVSEVVTDQKGEYRISPIRQGNFPVRCTAEGFPQSANTQLVAMISAGKEARLDFNLNSGLQMSGVVLNKNGEPVANATVNYRSMNMGRGGSSRRSNNPSGQGSTNMGGMQGSGSRGGNMGGMPGSGSRGGSMGNMPGAGSRGGSMGGMSGFGSSGGNMGGMPGFGSGGGNMGNMPGFGSGGGNMGNMPGFGSGGGSMGNMPGAGSRGGNSGDASASGTRTVVIGGSGASGSNGGNTGAMPGSGSRGGNMGGMSGFGSGGGSMGGMPGFGSGGSSMGGMSGFGSGGSSMGGMSGSSSRGGSTGSSTRSGNMTRGSSRSGNMGGSGALGSTQNIVPVSGSTTTDIKGRFLIIGLTDDAFQVNVQHRDYVELNTQLQPSTQQQTLVLDGAFSLRGTASNLQGVPFEQFSLMLQSNSTTNMFSKSCSFTASDGHFEVRGLMPDKYTIMLRVNPRGGNMPGFGSRSANTGDTTASNSENAGDITVYSSSSGNMPGFGSRGGGGMMGDMPGFSSGGSMGGSRGRSMGDMPGGDPRGGNAGDTTGGRSRGGSMGMAATGESGTYVGTLELQSSMQVRLMAGEASESGSETKSDLSSGGGRGGGGGRSRGMGTLTIIKGK
jgi:uncharacterized GH25 family protein